SRRARNAHCYQARLLRRALSLVAGTRESSSPPGLGLAPRLATRVASQVHAALQRKCRRSRLRAAALLEMAIGTARTVEGPVPCRLGSAKAALLSCCLWTLSGFLGPAPPRRPARPIDARSLCRFSRSMLTSDRSRPRPCAPGRARGSLSHGRL